MDSTDDEMPDARPESRYVAAEREQSMNEGCATDAGLSMASMTSRSSDLADESALQHLDVRSSYLNL